MNECYIKNNTVIISEWYKGTLTSVRRSALEYDHPQSIPSCLLNVGEDPKDYGYYRPCPICGRKG